MKIDEFIRKINEVAYATYEKDFDTIKIYANENLADINDWLFVLLPHRQDALRYYAWKNLNGVGFKSVGRVFDLVREFDNTPVDERFPQEKYTVQIIKGDYGSFLNFNADDHTAFLSGSMQTNRYKTCFAQAEIDKFKQRDDIAIDWDKAIIKPVEDDK